MTCAINCWGYTVSSSIYIFIVSISKSTTITGALEKPVGEFEMHNRNVVRCHSTHRRACRNEVPYGYHISIDGSATQST